MIASQIAWHSRNATEQGIVSREVFADELARGPKAVETLPKLGDETVFLRSGYAAHIHNAQPPRDALASALPAQWGLAEHLVVRDVSVIPLHLRIEAPLVGALLQRITFFMPSLSPPGT